MITIILPILNEAQNLEPIIKKINSVSPKYRIVFIDDNSQDGTLEILKRLSKRYNVGFFIRKNKRGYGSALKFGFEKIKAEDSDIIITMDADLSHDPKEIPALVKEINRGNDIVIGSRYIEGGKIEDWPFSRKVTSKLTNRVVRFVLATKIKDNTSGFRAYSGRIINRIKDKINSRGYSALEEILFLAIRENAKISERPIIFSNRKKGQSKARMIKEMIGLLNITLKLRKRDIKRFINYCIVGASGIAVNEGLLWLLTEKLGRHFLVSGAISIELSILSNFVLNDLWAFKDRRKGNYFWRMLKFNFFRILTGIVNWGILWGLTALGMNYLWSNLIGIAIATVMGYALSLRWVWK